MTIFFFISILDKKKKILVVSLRANDDDGGAQKMGAAATAAALGAKAKALEAGEALAHAAQEEALLSERALATQQRTVGSLQHELQLAVRGSRTRRARTRAGAAHVAAPATTLTRRKEKVDRGRSAARGGRARDAGRRSTRAKRR